MDDKQRLTDLQRFGLSQAEIGRRLGISQPKINQLCRGVRPNVTPEVHAALVKLHGNERRKAERRAEFEV